MSIIDYLNSSGYYAFTLPKGEKFPPPQGWTGHSKDISEDMVFEEIEKESEDSNIGISLPFGVVGIDIDSLESAEAKRIHEATRNSWRISSSDGKTRYTAFYTLPDGITKEDLKNIKGVDLITESHRYSVIHGIHPEGRRYKLFSPAGIEVDILDIPEPDDFEYLPREVIDLMKREREVKESKSWERGVYEMPRFGYGACSASIKTYKSGAEGITKEGRKAFLKGVYALSQMSQKGHAIGDLPLQLLEVFLRERGIERRKEAERILASVVYGENYTCENCSTQPSRERGFFLDSRLLRASGLEEQEVLSELFIRESSRGFETEAQLKSFREKTAKNLMIDLIRKQENRQKAEDAYGKNFHSKSFDIPSSAKLKESIENIASSKRQEKICYLIAYGFSDVEIAERLAISRATVTREKRAIKEARSRA